MSFPIDMYRYFETCKRADDRSRHELAQTMIELSRFDALALPFAVLDEEIDRALRARFGRPSQVRTCQVFGRGFRHIASRHIERGFFEWPTHGSLDGLPLSPGDKIALQGQLDRDLEQALLMAGPDDHARHGIDPAQLDHPRTLRQL